MAWKQGEVYQCPDPNCGCEAGEARSAGGRAPGVTQEPKPGQGGNQPPTCCCGKTMQKKSG
jgi:hypothetical protein